VNAHGLHLDLHVDGERCWTDLAIPNRFQGWDEIAHGGIVATILDEVMAWSLVDHDNWGLTARMTIDFKRPVPLERPVHAEGWVTEVRRRLITTAGRIVDQATGDVLATADATYVAASADRKRELKQRYGYQELEGNGV
jgi:acyl-coenzyme A thioesterase PaaI-like protein